MMRVSGFTLMLWWLSLTIPVSPWSLVPRVTPSTFESEREEFLASPGAIVRPLPHVPYEDTVLLRFSYQIPTSLFNTTDYATLDGDCPVDSILCKWDSQLEMLTKTIINRTAGNYTYWPTRPIRQKRGFMSLAAAAIPLVVEHFPKLLALFRPRALTPAPEENNAVVRVDANIPPSSLSGSLAKLGFDFLAYKSDEKLREQFDKNYLYKIHGLQLSVRALLEISTLDQAVSSCNQNLIPPRLVTMSNMKAALEQLRRRVGPFYVEPVLPSDQVSLYYSLRGAQCKIQNGSFDVTFRIPIRQIGDKLSLYRLSPVFFKIQDLKCFLLEAPVTLALANDRAYVLPDRYCEEGEFFCSLPRDKNADSLNACFKPFFGYSAIQTEKCEPQCSRTTEPVVTQSGPSEFYVITDDAFPIQISCPNSPVVTLPDVYIGSDLISLPCPCAITYGTTTLVAPRLLCDNHTLAEVQAKQVVPIQWTKRILTKFTDLLSGLATIRKNEITLTTEDDVPYTENDTELPKWTLELVTAVGGAFFASVLACLVRICNQKKCFGCANKNQDEVQLVEIPSQVAPALPPRLNRR